MLNPIGTKMLYTPRLLLRPFKYEDSISLFYNYGSKYEVTKYLNWNNYQNIEQAEFVVRTFIKSYNDPYYFNWAIIDKSTNNLIGSISLHRLDHENECGELGICVAPNYWNKRIGYEACKTILDFGFKTIGLHRIESRVHVENVASNALMRKLLMSLEGTMVKAFKKNGKFHNINLYAIIEEQK